MMELQEAKPNHRKRGSNRDSKLRVMLEDWGVMDSRQIHLMLFNDIDTGLRKAQERLFKLHRQGKVIRWRSDGQYVYSLNEKEGLWRHKLALNWVRAWIYAQTKNWERIHCFLYEQTYGKLRADAFCAIRNNEQSKFKFLFIELDHNSERNKFNKVEIYNRLFEEVAEGKYDRWWVHLTERFPKVLIATTNPARKEKIIKHIEEENTNNLEFEVMTLDNIKREVIK